MRHAAEDFAATNDVDRRLSALRNFATNGFTVTEMLRRLKTIPTTAAEYAQWWPTAAQRLADSDAAAFFKRLRTDLTHTTAPVIGGQVPFWVPENLRAVRTIVQSTGHDVIPLGVVGTTEDGREIFMPPAGPPVTIIGESDDPEAAMTAPAPLMRPYFELLTSIVIEAHDRFGE